MRKATAPTDMRGRQLLLERRLQTGAAILLGLIVLIVAVVRASASHVLPAGWWRHW